MKMFSSKFNTEIKIIFFFVIWRVFISLAAYLSPKIIPLFANRFPYVETLISYGLPHWIWSFGNFDGVHYLRIAKDGYAYQYTQAFFPIYPILIKIVSLITFGNYLIAALIVSNISFLIALIIFNKLVSKIYNANIAFWSVVFLLTFPTSYYFGAVYTEGLFFLLIIYSFYLLEEGKKLHAAILGAFASSTRLVGLFLIVPAFIKKNIKNQWILLITPAGLLTYMIYLQIKFNNAFYFLTAQSAFGQNRETAKLILLPQVLYRWINQLFTTRGLVFANSALELLATILAISLICIGYKKIKNDWLIFSILVIIFPTLTGSLASMPRYVIIAFPIYIVLAHIKNNIFKKYIAILFATLLFILTIYFSQGYWVA